VTIVATDVAGNETEQLITVSVKIFTRGFAINGKNVNDESGHSVWSLYRYHALMFVLFCKLVFQYQ
jgi:hypothetical protein